MSLLKKLTDYAKSPEAKSQAQELAGKAKKFANDPKRKEEFESVKRKVSEKLGKDEPEAKPTTPPTAGAEAGAEAGAGAEPPKPAA